MVGKPTTNLVHLVKVVDYFLIATTLLILAMSLPELFIAKFNVPDGPIGHNLREFTVTLGGTIVMVMAVKFPEKPILAEDVSLPDANRHRYSGRHGVQGLCWLCSSSVR